MAQHSFDAETAQILQTFGFEAEVYKELRKKLLDGHAFDSNAITGKVEPPKPEDVTKLPELGSPERDELTAEGRQLIADGKVALVVLAGGMATRFGGVVKALVPVIDGRSFLELKLRDAETAARDAGGVVPVYLMTSFATDAGIKAALSEMETNASRPAATFAQHISVRLDERGEPFLVDGKPSLYATGHGDLPSALRRGGVLDAVRKMGVEVLAMSNVDNATATLDPAVVALHARSGAPMTAEMAPKHAGDKGGAPARVDGRKEIVEGFRFPADFDQDSIPVFNTNTLLFNVDALDQPFDLTWFAVRKKVEGREAVQFERLVGELSSFLDCHFVEVARTGADARFQPIKTPADLDARAPEIEAALKSRGILP